MVTAKELGIGAKGRRDPFFPIVPPSAETIEQFASQMRQSVIVRGTLLYHTLTKSLAAKAPEQIRFDSGIITHRMVREFMGDLVPEIYQYCQDSGLFSGIEPSMMEKFAHVKWEYSKPLDLQIGLPHSEPITRWREAFVFILSSDANKSRHWIDTENQLGSLIDRKIDHLQKDSTKEVFFLKRDPDDLKIYGVRLHRYIYFWMLTVINRINNMAELEFQNLMDRFLSVESKMNDAINLAEKLERATQEIKREKDSLNKAQKQLEKYFNIIQEQNKQLLSPRASQPEVGMSDVLNLIREMKSD
jgi:hypothetical protein